MDELFKLILTQFPGLLAAIVVVAAYRKLFEFTHDVHDIKKVLRVVVDILKDDNGNAKKLLEEVLKDAK